MPAQTLPGIGLSAEWDLGENGWNAGMDENMMRLSALVGLSVPTLSAMPDAALAGPQINPATGAISVWRDDAWWTYPPFTGMRAHVVDEGRSFVWSGSAWLPASELPSYVVSEITESRPLTETELRGSVLVVNSPTDVTLTVPAAGVATIPAGSTMARQPTTVVQAGAGRVTVAGAAGVAVHAADDMRTTRLQHSVLSIIPIAADAYVVAGDVAA